MKIDSLLCTRLSAGFSAFRDPSKAVHNGDIDLQHLSYSLCTMISLRVAFMELKCLRYKCLLLSEQDTNIQAFHLSFEFEIYLNTNSYIVHG
jgi:hypothetical protein